MAARTNAHEAAQTRDTRTSFPPRMTPGRGKGPARSGDDTLRMRLEGGVEAAGAARRALSRLRGDLDPSAMETMRLLVTELVSNSVRHAGAETVGLRVLVRPSALWTEVSDRGPGFDPERRERGVDRESGWGLFLVERLAERWGVSQEDGHTRVWFELRRAA